MKFINKGPSIRVPVGESENRKRVALDTGQTIDLPQEIGERLGLEVTDVTGESKQVKVTEGKIGKTKVETKQFEDQYTADDFFFKELTKIKGLGVKTAKDIVVWGTKEKLIEVIEVGGSLPFRDDIVKKLRRKYG